MKIFWKLYACLFLIVVVNNAVLILDKNSVLGVYYSALVVFSNWYLLSYFFNILNALIASLICLYIFCYAFDIPGLKPLAFWLFGLRLFTEMFGHGYELKIIQAGFTQGFWLGALELAALVVPLLPSYFVQPGFCSRSR